MGERTMQESLDLLRLAAGRRRVFGGAAAAAGLLAISPVRALAANAAPAGITDVDILNFALNLEYLEAEFYWNAAFGRSLPESDTTGKGDQGKLIGGRKVQFKDMAIKQFAKEIAEDERDHVLFLRKALGKDAVAQPAIDLRNSSTRPRKRLASAAASTRSPTTTASSSAPSCSRTWA